MGAAEPEPKTDGTRCLLPASSPEVLDGTLGWVRVLSRESVEGAEEIARINADGFRDPDFRYPDLEGAAWGDLQPDEGRMGLGAVSSIVVGDQVVQITLRGTGVDRSPQADLLALTRQVAGSLGLGDA